MTSPFPLLIQALQSPTAYRHPVAAIKVVETHISWVLLTGQYAYKIKKPVDLGFLDFSTLERRRHYCAEELRLNRRLAPAVYESVVAITGTEDHPQIAGAGAAIEYAVKMRQFDPEQQADRLLENDNLKGHMIEQLAAEIARFHADSPRADPDTPYGRPEAVWRPILENFETMVDLTEDGAERDALETLRHWSQQRFDLLRDVFIGRKRDGHVRECHGDMHLGNITRFEGRFLLFDCLEFNEALRWIDTMSDIAFLIMDLEARDQPALANLFLNRYLECLGDYEGLEILVFYKTYRALVRAKVAAIQAHQVGADADAECRRRYLRYRRLATRYSKTPRAALMITHGLSGSGKTTMTSALLGPLGAVRIRSDIERKRLFGLTADQRSDSGLDAQLYTSNASERTYTRLMELAGVALRAGFTVIVDATFLKRSQRRRFQTLAAQEEATFLVLHCMAPETRALQWIRERRKRAEDASEADEQVYRRQQASIEPLDDVETLHTLTVDSGAAIDYRTIAAAVRERLHEIE